MTSSTPDDFVVSFKAHPGYDSPSFTIRGSSAAELDDRIKAAEAQGLFATIGNADTLLRAAFNLGAYAGATPAEHPSTVESRGNSRPAAPNAAPPGVGPAPTCPHGTKTYKTGNGKRGKWEAWMCPTPQGTQGQCPPEWIN